MEEWEKKWLNLVITRADIMSFYNMENMEYNRSVHAFILSDADRT